MGAGGSRGGGMGLGAGGGAFGSWVLNYGCYR